jgi:hypothetical protein
MFFSGETGYRAPLAHSSLWYSLKRSELLFSSVPRPPNPSGSHPVYANKNSLQTQAIFIWRRDRDSNPGYGCPHTRVPGVHLQPLGHLSSTFYYTDFSGQLRRIKNVVKVSSTPCPRGKNKATLYGMITARYTVQFMSWFQEGWGSACQR